MPSDRRAQGSVHIKFLDERGCIMRSSQKAAAMLAVLGMGASIGAAGVRAAPKVPREQRMPAIAFNADPAIRDYLLVWIEDRGPGPDVYGKRLANSGLPQGGPDKSGAQVIREDPNRRSEPHGPRADPALVYNPTQQEYFLVYSERVSEEAGWDVFGARVNPNGFSVTQPRLLAGGPGDQQRPDVDLIDIQNNENEDGDYLVVFDDNTRDRDEIWAARIRGNGIPKAKPYLLFRGDDMNRANATDPTTNGSLVAWVDDRAGQTDIWSLRLNNGKPYGQPDQLINTPDEDEFAPRYGVGLQWNVFDPASGTDVRGVQVYANNLTRGPSVGILVPAADQSWPDSAAGAEGMAVTIFADNRSGEFDLYAVRLASNLRRQGREFPVLVDYLVP